MKLRKSPSSPVQEVSLTEFKLLVKNGEVEPTALVWDENLTDATWRTADELGAFHRASPRAYPPGPIRAKRLARFKPPPEIIKTAQEACARYRSGITIEECYGLDRLDESGLVGEISLISRLFILPALRVESVVTLAFGKKTVLLQASQGTGDTVWSSVEQAAVDSKGNIVRPKPFDRTKVLTRSNQIALEDVRDWFMSAEQLILRAGNAPSCSPSDVRIHDGIAFLHRVLMPGQLQDARWENPQPAVHKNQLELVAAYVRLLRHSGFEQFMPSTLAIDE